MPVNPSLTRKVLVLHGVQTGPDNLNQHTLVDELIKSRIGKIPLSYACELYRYENINAAAEEKYKTLLNLLVANPVGQVVGDDVLEMVGDVVISLENGSTADMIRQGLRQAILEIFAAGNPCYIVAHSLGTIYTFDVLNALLGAGGYFDPGSRKTWPVQGLLTIGAPIGLDMFKVTGRDSIKDFGSGEKWFRWLNLWDPNDPVVSGNIFGQHLSGFKIAEQFLSGQPEQGWVASTHPIKTNVARRCEECRVGNAFHAWREQHLTPSFNWAIDFTASVNIPTGKRAVIELITASISVPSGERAGLRLYTSLGYAASNLDFVLTSQGKVGGRDIFVATHSVRVYSDQLIEFNVNRDNAQTEGDAFICISGYLIDV